MPWNEDAGVRSLRLAYNAALSAHANRARALQEAIMRGEMPSAGLIESEKHALRQLEATRAKLHTAMARAIGPGPEPPDPAQGKG